MQDPRKSMKVFMFYTALIISILLLCKMTVAEEVVHSKIKVIKPEDTGGQYCYITVEITQVGDTIYKKEILNCADGRKNPASPGYWDLFAQFYYHDTTQPEYCRKYARPGHAFKSFGEGCLNANGEWEVQ